MLPLWPVDVPVEPAEADAPAVIATAPTPAPNSKLPLVNSSKDFFRLAPGREVRLRYAYFVTCVGVEKDARGAVVTVRCNYDPATRGGDSPDGRKVKGTIHWVNAGSAVDAEVRLYDHLFEKPNPEEAPEGQTFLANLNPKSLEVLTGSKLEPSVAGSAVGKTFQFERLGYFCVDRDSTPGKLVFNRAVTLRDTWAKIEKKAKPAGAD